MYKARRAALGLMASAALSAALPALAQEKYPTRPITFIVPFPPGGPTDAMARILATGLTEHYKQAAIVDNRPGASGNIGIDMVKRAKPDGHTLLVVDDVLYTGHSLLRVVEYLARKQPAEIHVAMLVDRGATLLPVRADVVGVRLDIAPSDIIECNVPPYEAEFKIELLQPGVAP